MDRRVPTVALIFSVFTAISAASALQPSADDQRRDGIMLMRAINNAELRVRRQTGKYVVLTELIDHPMMTNVKPQISVSGTSITFKSAQLRLALSADGAQYVATAVSGAPNYVAVFTDERGVIYTGKALE